MGRAFEKEFEMAEMTEARMGEIALKLLMAKWTAEGGVKIGPEWKRTCGQLSKDTGIPREDLNDFSKKILVRFIGKAYEMQQVSLEMSNSIPKETEKK